MQSSNNEKYDLKYLKLLSKEYPNIQSACTEIINLQAILNL
ncbi:MAG: fructose-bisphosphatase class III [Lachnospiraceae bacterium]